MNSNGERAPDRLEVRICGSGGQGVLLTAVLLADAVLAGGKRVVQTQSYGPEARGGASKAEIVISDAEIDYPEVNLADITLCLSKAAFVSYAGQTVAGGLVCLDDGLIRGERAQPGVLLLGAPFSHLAVEETGDRVVTNIVALGALASHAALASEEALAAALERRVPARLLERNRRALRLGFATPLRVLPTGD